MSLSLSAPGGEKKQLLVQLADIFCSSFRLALEASSGSFMEASQAGGIFPDEVSVRRKGTWGRQCHQENLLRTIFEM